MSFAACRGRPHSRPRFAAAALAACAALGAAQDAGRPIDLEVARAAFEEARAIAAADGGELWGVPLAFPILLVDPASRRVVASQADAEGRLAKEERLWTGAFPAERGIANFATEWAGKRWTMLVWPLPEDETARARLLLHECFHNAQPGLGIAAGGAPCAHLETLAGRLWTRLEARALAAALRASLAGDADARDEAARDALLFRARRRALFPGAAEGEDGLERLEGSAEYTGVRLCSADPRVRSEAAVGLLEGLRERPSLTRSFQYATGPALGLLLDDLDPFWREAFVEGATLGELLGPAVWFETPAPAELEPRALERAARYGLDALSAEETAREEQRQRRLAGYRARFVEGPVLALPARTPETSFDPSRIEVLDGVGSVYGRLWVSDEWGVADAPGGALVLESGDVRLAAPRDVEGPALAGDGWTLELAAGWTVVPGAREGDWRVVRGGR